VSALATLALACAAIGTAQDEAVRSMVADAMRDAQARSSLSPHNQHAGGHDGSFFLGTPDDSFRLEISGFTQFRYIANLAGDRGPDEFTGGFTNRRTRLAAQGHVIDPSLSFTVTQLFGRSGGVSELSDAYIQRDFDHGMSVRFGQFKLPFWGEESHSAKRLLAVERSLTREAFSLGRSQAVMLSARTDTLRGDFAVSNGAGSANIGFASDPTDYAVTARGQWLIDGSFRPFRRAGAIAGEDFSWLASAAVHAEESSGSAGTPDSRIVTWTADTALRDDGWSLLAAYVGRSHSSANAGTSAHDHALLVQGAALVSDDVELVARYDVILPDNARAGDEPFSTLTVGVNWYIHGDALKISADLSWHPDAATGNDLVGGATGAGFLGSAERDELVIRVQAQLVF